MEPFVDKSINSIQYVREILCEYQFSSNRVKLAISQWMQAAFGQSKQTRVGDTVHRSTPFGCFYDDDDDDDVNQFFKFIKRVILQGTSKKFCCSRYRILTWCEGCRLPFGY